jgi:very-short-patch-repair endonuclease
MKQLFGGLIKTMNKTAIKKYAAAARLKLIDAVAAKMRCYGFDESGSMTGAAIEEIGGEVVQTAAFVLNARKLAGFQGTYARLVDFGSQDEKEAAFLSGEHRHVTTSDDFAKIPESPIAYWVSKNGLKAYERGIFIKDIAAPRAGLATGDNTIYQRYWFEVMHNSIGLGFENVEQTIDDFHKWYPCNSGGEFRKWYANIELVVDWESNGKRLRNLRNAQGKLAARPQNTQYYFKEGLTWNKLSSSRFAVKHKAIGSIYDDTSRSAFPHNSNELFYIIGFLCSVVTFNYLKALNPTMSFTNGDLERLPYIHNEGMDSAVSELVAANIALSRADWDAFETSWDFKTHPLIQPPPPAGGTPFKEGGEELRHYNALLTPRARELRTGATRQENHLWYDFLRSHRPRFTRQRVFGNYILDFYCADAKLAIELDGSQHYEPETMKKDQERTEFLNSYGVTVIRFANTEIDHNFDGVCAAIESALAKAPFSEGGAPKGRGLQSAFDAWERERGRRFDTLKANEEELNRIFIDVYGLRDELTPEVADKDVTVRRADKLREVKSFVSYAVGCMFGRYSLDVDGLAYAGGAWDAGKYTTFLPDKDNVLPINDEADYFDDDIVVRFAQFVRAVYGEATLEDNLAFIGDTLYPDKDGSARDKIRRYFANDFYKDHVKIYQKKPIYWQFDSGKQGGFKALVYLHRYDKYTVGRVRTEYMHPQQRMYDDEIKRIDQLADLPETTAREKAAGQKRVELLRKKITECREYDAVIAHIALQNPEIDLDDGVTANYARFQGVEVALGDGRPPKKMDLLTKI